MGKTHCQRFQGLLSIVGASLAKFVTGILTVPGTVGLPPLKGGSHVLWGDNYLERAPLELVAKQPTPHHKY